MLSWIRNLHTCKTELLLARQGLANPGPFPTPSTAGAASGVLWSLPSVLPLCRSPVGSILPARSLGLGWDC